MNYRLIHGLRVPEVPTRYRQ